MKRSLFRKLTRCAFILLALPVAATLNVTNAQESDTRNPDNASSATLNAETTPQAEIKQELAAALLQITDYRETLQQLKTQRSQVKGLREDMLNARISRTLDQLISLSHSTAKTFLSKESEVAGFNAERAQIVKVIASLPSLIDAEIANIRNSLALPRADQTALDQAAFVAELEVAAKADDKLIDTLIVNNEIAAQLGMDISATDAAVRKQIIRGAENASAYLDVTMAELDKLRRQLATLPKNQELLAKISVTEKHILVVADILRQRAKRMATLGIDISWIDTQLIAATGALTTEIFNWNVVTTLASDFFVGITSWISEHGARIVFQILVFLAILAISWKLAHLGTMVTRRALSSMRVSLSQLLQRMIVSTTRGVILILGVLIGLSQLGVSIGPLLAGLGIAGFIIGFALQDSLSNFASGLMILLYRPFDMGDVVDVNGAFGTVRRMSLVNTTILTFDNQTLVVPNNQVWQNVIKNLTGQDTRRVDMVFGISYSDDVEKAERVLREIVAANAKILEQPEPIIKLHKLGDSSVDFIVRPWVRTEDYWDAYWSVTREVKMRFDREGISIPFPQRDVHLYTQSQAVKAHSGD